MSRRPDIPDDFESTDALTSAEIEIYEEEVDENAVTGRGRSRDVIIPFDYSPDEAVTEQLRAAHTVEVADAGYASEANLSSEPQLQSEPEPPPPPQVAMMPPPISIPVPTVSEPEALTPPLIPAFAPPPFDESGPRVAPSDGEAPTMAPPWVLDYVLLCVVLTLVGLVVLFIQHRMLGSASPF